MDWANGLGWVINQNLNLLADLHIFREQKFEPKMVWHSILSIAMVDVLVLSISALALISMVRHRRYLPVSGSILGLLCIVGGIFLFALYHGADLILVAVTPQVLAPAAALEVIGKLHPDAAWITGSYGLVLIVWGFLIVTKNAASQIQESQALNAKLEAELKAHMLTETELEETQRQLRLKVINLERTSAAYERRGAELAQGATELRAARDQAENANRSKSEFLALMSHELRTPLNAVIGFSEMIKEETFGPVGSPKYRDYAEDIHASGRHLLEVINDILDLSKVEAGAEELLEEVVVAGDLAKAAMTLVQGRASRGGVALDLDLPNEPVTLMADERKLKQILINLLSNSVKYTQSGGSCNLKVRSDASKGLIFTISDTGIGIADNDIPRVLSQFGQVQNRLNRKLTGSGLGLPLTMALVNLHGGTMSIESAVGLGTTVTVILPPQRILNATSDDGVEAKLKPSPVLEAEQDGSEMMQA